MSNEHLEAALTQRSKMRIAAAEFQGWSGPWRFGNLHLHGTPPDAKQPATGFINDKHVPDEIDNLVKDLCDQIIALVDGIDAVRALIDESKGVSGLSLNGDVAQWSELQEDGDLWEWLFLFNRAERTISNNGEITK